MKTASKVFVWISLIFSSLAFILCLFLTFNSLFEFMGVSDGRLYIPEMLFLIVPIVVSIIALVKLKKAQKKQELTAIAIVTIILSSLLGGIFMLCIPEKDFENTSSNQ
ncbi:MAG: hypothetical protein ACI4L6_03520 [Candidatus Onthoplasma sp.]